MQQLSEEKIWEIVKNFYTSFTIFHHEYKKYELQISKHTKNKYIDTKELQNHPDIHEFSHLIDYHKISDLLDEYLVPLSKLIQYCIHNFSDKDFHLLYYYAKDICYEVSMLKDECRKPAFPSQGHKPSQELQYNGQEFNMYLPMKTIHLFHLFRKMKYELEKIISSYQDSKIILRSLYLFGKDVVAGVYEGGFHEFLAKIYPQGICEMNYRAMISFHDSGFIQQAQKAGKQVHKMINKAEAGYYPLSWRENVDKILEQKT